MAKTILLSIVALTTVSLLALQLPARGHLPAQPYHTSLKHAQGDNASLPDDRVEGPNLILNGTIESLSEGTPKPWIQKTWSGEPLFEVENGFGRESDHCLKISSENGADASWSFRVKLKRNTNYRMGAWIKTEALEEGGFGAQLNIHELQLEGKTEPLKGTHDWTRVTSEFNSGNHETVLLNCLFGGWGRATGTAWFDDVKLVELVEPMPEMSPAEAEAFFESQVYPILEQKCFECHGGGEEIRAEFVLTNREDLIRGGESGEAIDLESPNDSLFLEAINFESYEMPPDGKLPEEELQILTTWVRLGAPWKGEGFKPDHADHGSSVPQVNEETKQWWSFQPIERPVPPQVDADWPRNDIDRFILARLNENNLSPAAQADRTTLIRRAYYDLIGLPPTPEEVQAFVDDPSPDAYERLIDRLLESPHYGEKWARHWLDLVRYGESNSYERDGTKPFVWKYRDYVIRSLNDDKPYDQFLMEQLAGDEMENSTADQIIATGFYRLGIWDDEPADPQQAWYDDMDDILATTTDSMLGLTVGCARCHDHKIDPIPQSDYYRLLAFFRNVRRYGVRAHETVLDASTRIIAPDEIRKSHDRQVKAYEDQVTKNRSAMSAIETIVKEDFIPVEHEEFKHEMHRVPLVRKRVENQVITAAQADTYARLFDEMKRLRREKPKALESALCVKERGGDPLATYVLIRGNAHAEGEQVEPGFPSVLSPPEPVVSAPADKQSTGRRLALAQWIANEANPLTARVIVNRVWQYHLGRGIVRTSSDFGFQGTAPTHPLLLDWLASEFMDGGWKLKRLHKMIMLSQTYQMSSQFNAAAFEKDPLNDFFWRVDMRRLTAEEVRDSILAINGSLNKDKMFGPSIFPVIPDEVLQGQSRPGENWHTSSPDDVVRRSIYIHIKRSLPVPLMASFDVADPDTPCPVRFNTVQPTQALAMINSDFLNEQAKIFAQDLKRIKPDDLEAQISLALRRATQRTPTRQEIQRGINFVKSMKNDGIDDPLKQFCLLTLNLNEFIYLD